MVAIAKNNIIYLARENSPEVEKVSTKQLKSIEEQAVRYVKKNAKRQEKAATALNLISLCFTCSGRQWWANKCIKNCCGCMIGGDILAFLVGDVALF